MRWEPDEDDDQVKRKYRFQAEHPEWHFISPLDPRSLMRGETDWRAIGPPGSDLVRDPELRGLLDRLEKLVTE